MSAARFRHESARRSGPPHRPEFAGWERGAIVSDEMPVLFFDVIPARAGIQGFWIHRLPLIPAFAGMTVENKDAATINCNRPGRERAH
jgi:hypothetical protein